MLPTNLTTNEVKNSSGTEVEFLRNGSIGREVTFAKSGEAPNLQNRIKVSHTEIGKGVDLRRRSLLRVDLQVAGVSGKTRNIGCYAVADIPAGDISAMTEVKNALAMLISLLASTGADTTIKFDCTGYGADALVNGSL